MKQLFRIENGSSDSGQQSLALRLGEKHGSFAITNKTGAELYQLAYCAVDDWNESELHNFFAAYPEINNSFYQVHVSYDFSPAILVSSKDYKEQDSRLLLHTTTGNSATNNVSELIAEWQLYNTYAVPKEIQEWVTKKFPAATSRHQYSLGIKNIQAVSPGNLVVDVRTDSFTVMAAGNSKFLLAQTFEYSTPADVLYYLLKICKEFSLPQQEVRLSISGLIDKQSALYKELYQYFIYIEFREPGWNVKGEYPGHFFTSLNDLARCAS